MTEVTKIGQINRRLSTESLVALSSPNADAVMNRLADLEAAAGETDAGAIKRWEEEDAEAERLNKQVNELIAVLEKIASLRYSNSSAASVAQSAIDTIRALQK